MRVRTSQLSSNGQHADGVHFVFNMLSPSMCTELRVHQIHLLRLPLPQKMAAHDDWVFMKIIKVR